MFDKGYVFKGRHAEYVNDLTKNYDDDGHKLFNRNYDVYLLAPVVGFLYQRKADPDQSGDFRTSILPDILMKNSDDLMFNFRLVMILDKKAEPDPVSIKRSKVKTMMQILNCTTAMFSAV